MRKKNIVMVTMLTIVAVMSIAYAFFATNLNITSTGSISSSWDVKFIGITNDTPVGSATNLVTPSYTATTATMSADLKLPGDSITYRITLKNNGDIPAIIEDIDASATGSGAIVFSLTGLNIGEKLAAKAEKEIIVKIEYDPNTTSQPQETTKTLTVSVRAVQDTGQSIDTIVPGVDQPLLLFSQILKNNVAQEDTNIDFGQISSDTNGKGLYYTSTNTENNQTTYYFRGAVDNNYVNFGTENTCKYNGIKAQYVSNLDNLEFSVPTETQCTSTNVCNLSWFGGATLGIRNLVGLTETECDTLASEIPWNDIDRTSTKSTCVYNEEPVLEINAFAFEITETQCTSTNVCVADPLGAGTKYPVVGWDSATCVSNGGTWTGENATYQEFNPYSSNKATYTKNDSMLWRIVRINEDGSIRIITQDSVGSSAFNENNDDNAYVGYMYGTIDATGNDAYKLTHTNTTDSTIKDYLDDWYNSNLSSYSSYLADAGFCNDRSIAPNAGLWNSIDTALGYAKNQTYYGAYNRLRVNKTPQFACLNPANDLFTTSTSSKGNKALTNPIGLLTADEVAYAGGVYSTLNASMYLTNGSFYWTMSPFFFDGIRAFEWFVYSSGIVSNYNVRNDPVGVRPVVNLQSGVEIIGGDGTFENPYIIK